MTKLSNQEFNTLAFTASLHDIVDSNHGGLLSKHSSWPRVKLSEVCTILNGFPFESAKFSKDRGTSLIRILDILNGETETYFDGEYDEEFLVEAGELIVGMDGDFNLLVGPIEADCRKRPPQRRSRGRHGCGRAYSGLQCISRTQVNVENILLKTLANQDFHCGKLAMKAWLSSSAKKLLSSLDCWQARSKAKSSSFWRWVQLIET